MRKISRIISVIFISLLSSSVYASTPVIDDRQKHQKQRIERGVSSGELTRKETRHLVKGQAELTRMERRAKADGIVTKYERARLHNKANAESAKIANNKHDKQKQPKAKKQISRAAH